MSAAAVSYLSVSYGPQPAPAELRQAAKRMRRARVSLARKNPAEFNAYVLRDEESGAPIENGPLHLEMHRLMSAHSRLAILAHIEAGKTTQLIGRVLWELGRNPNLRIVIGSETDGKAVQILSVIKNYIENSAALRRVFPTLRRSPVVSDPWTKHAITVARRVSGSKDPSVKVVGVGRGSVMGSRIDILILDDTLSFRNSRTREQRAILKSWYQQNFASRITRQGRIWAVNTAYDPDDLIQWLSKKRGWAKVIFPVANDNGHSTWPSRWSLERIALAEEELGPIEAKRQLYCVPIGDDVEKFQRPWILRCLENGRGLNTMPMLPPEELPEGCFCITGVDLATKRQPRPGSKGHTHTAVTCFFTILVYPDGARQVLNITSGRWSGPDIADHARSVHLRFGSVLYVEDNGAQQYLLDQIAQLAEQGPVAIPVIPFHTGGNKWHPVYGVEGLGAEFAAGKWIIPSLAENPEAPAVADDPEVLAWLDDLYTYTASSHSGDRLMAGWIAREGARQRLAERGGSVGVSVIREEQAEPTEAEAAASAGLVKMM